jgi:hypothetical protein
VAALNEKESMRILNVLAIAAWSLSSVVNAQSMDGQMMDHQNMDHAAHMKLMAESQRQAECYVPT